MTWCTQLQDVRTDGEDKRVVVPEIGGFPLQDIVDQDLGIGGADRKRDPFGGCALPGDRLSGTPARSQRDQKRKDQTFHGHIPLEDDAFIRPDAKRPAVEPAGRFAHGGIDCDYSQRSILMSQFLICIVPFWARLSCILKARSNSCGSWPIPLAMVSFLAISK